MRNYRARYRTRGLGTMSVSQRLNTDIFREKAATKFIYKKKKTLYLLRALVLSSSVAVAAFALLGDFAAIHTVDAVLVAVMCSTVSTSLYQIFLMCLDKYP